MRDPSWSLNCITSIIFSFQDCNTFPASVSSYSLMFWMGHCFFQGPFFTLIFYFGFYLYVEAFLSVLVASIFKRRISKSQLEAVHKYAELFSDGQYTCTDWQGSCFLVQEPPNVGICVSHSSWVEQLLQRNSSASTQE